MRDLAAESGMSYATLRAWSTGVRVPSDEGVERLAEAFARLSAREAQTAEKLRRLLS